MNRLKLIFLLVALIGFGMNSYAERGANVKYMCGNTANNDDVVTGRYETAIDVFNPHNVPNRLATTLNFNLVISVIPSDFAGTAPYAYTPGIEMYSTFNNTTMEAYQNLHFNCDSIRAALGVPSGYIEGQVVLTQSGLYEPRITATHSSKKRTGTDPDSKIYDVQSVCTSTAEFYDVFIGGQD